MKQDEELHPFIKAVIAEYDAMIERAKRLVEIYCPGEEEED